MQYRKIQTDLIVLFIIYILLLLFSMSESSFIVNFIHSSNLASGQNTIMGSLSSITLFLLCLKIVEVSYNCRENIFSKLGRYSFGIYLLHGVVGLLLKKGCSFFIDFNNSLINYILVVSIIFFSYLIAVLIDKILPLTYSKLFGIK